METFRTLDMQVQHLQNTLNPKGYGHLGMGVAGALMLFVFCPMTIVAMAAPYWTSSAEINGYTMSSQASLWKISVSTDIKGVSGDQDTDMCGDQMNGFDECGKIHAVRFFAITALLFSLASGMTLVVGFLPALKPSADLRRTMLLVGLSFSSAVLLCDFLGMCIAASVSMTGESKLNGAGFVFLILKLPFVGVATALVACTLTRWSTKNVTMAAGAVDTQVAKVGKSPSEADGPPTLLSPPQKGVQQLNMNDSNVSVPEENEKNVETSSTVVETVVVEC
jgi:hypothetical protein